MHRNKRNPAIAVILVALVILSGVLVGKYFYELRMEVNAQVQIDQLAEETETKRAAATAFADHLMDGEVARTALRTREAAALALVAGLKATQTDFESVGALALALQADHKVPPTLEIAPGQPGAFTSRYGTCYLRYRSVPLGVEVVSVAKEDKDGPSLIVRLDTSVSEVMGAVFWRAKRLGIVTVPEPFVQTYQVNPLDWQQEVIRETQISQVEQGNLRAWVEAVGRKR